jgi:hypothetical protein
MHIACIIAHAINDIAQQVDSRKTKYNCASNQLLQRAHEQSPAAGAGAPKQYRAFTSISNAALEEQLLLSPPHHYMVHKWARGREIKLRETHLDMLVNLIAALISVCPCWPALSRQFGASKNIF